jgi:hypothetical protein
MERVDAESDQAGKDNKRIGKGAAEEVGSALKLIIRPSLREEPLVGWML